MLAGQLTIRRKQQYQVLQDCGHNMGERRSLCVSVSNGSHIVQFQTALSKYSPEPVTIPAGTEHVTVYMEYESKGMFRQGIGTQRF